VSLSSDIFILEDLGIMKKKCSFVIFPWSFDGLYARSANYILITRSIENVCNGGLPNLT
jgi:hypothetical protein